MYLTLLLPLLFASGPGQPAAATADDPPIRIWINNDGRFLRGDRAKVHVRTEDDGYLVVLHADAEGHLRVLFPLDPTDDNFVRGGKKYEVEGRGGRDAFDVGDRSGRGTVYAAVSRSPFRFDEFVLSDHWDYKALEPRQLAEDPEPELTELVRRMAQGSFDYDVMSYYVVDRVVYANDYSYSRPYYSGFYYDDFGCGYYRSCGSGLSVSLFFGRPFYRRHYYWPVPLRLQPVLRSVLLRSVVLPAVLLSPGVLLSPALLGLAVPLTSATTVARPYTPVPVPGSHRDERGLSRPPLHLRPGGEHGVHPAGLPVLRARQCLADPACGGAGSERSSVREATVARRTQRCHARAPSRGEPDRAHAGPRPRDEAARPVDASSGRGRRESTALDRIRVRRETCR